MNTKKILKKRCTRAQRVRYKIKQSGQLRASVFRSAKQIYVQLIDDAKAVTLASASSLDPVIAKKCSSAKEKVNKKNIAFFVGELFGERVKQIGIDTIAFDRGCYLYHGRVKSLAEGIVHSGLNI